jgi:protein-disulfide isomerase
MQLSRTTLFIIAGAALMVASVFLALQLASNRSDESAPAFATSKADIERIVHDYLMAHPEVIFDSVKQMETKENDDRLSLMRQGAKTHAAQLFHEPGAIMVGNPNGDVTIVEFFDYHCTYCRKVVADLMSLVKEAKGAHYAPKSVEFVEEIPLSPLGKPDKKALRAQYWSDATRQVN